MLSDMGFRGWHSVVLSVVQYFEIRPSTNRILKNDFQNFITLFSLHYKGIWGHTVAQFVEVPCYKLKGQGFDSQWCHWSFSMT
jgi:hypothetical protein